MVVGIGHYWPSKFRNALYECLPRFFMQHPIPPCRRNPRLLGRASVLGHDLINPGVRFGLHRGPYVA